MQIKIMQDKQKAKALIEMAKISLKRLNETDKEKISFEIEKLIRAYDPCMSCGAHFLKVDWK